jgi:hypothetical protein
MAIVRTFHQKGAAVLEKRKPVPDYNREVFILRKLNGAYKIVLEPPSSTRDPAVPVGVPHSQAPLYLSHEGGRFAQARCQITGSAAPEPEPDPRTNGRAGRSATRP